MVTLTKVAPETKVWQVIERYPYTAEVFRSHGCPDMRRGFFRIMAHLMSVERAARMHKIPPATLIAALNSAIVQRERTPDDVA
jgi:hypothetical protein